MVLEKPGGYSFKPEITNFFLQLFPYHSSDPSCQHRVFHPVISGNHQPVSVIVFGYDYKRHPDSPLISTVSRS